MLLAFIGVIIGTAVFGAGYFSAAQVFRQTGWLSRAHLGLVALTIIGMGSISLIWPTVALAAGLLIVPAALAAMILESGANRLLPLAQLAFAYALVSGLPFV